MLITSLEFSFLQYLVGAEQQGVCVCAHVDRDKSNEVSPPISHQLSSGFKPAMSHSNSSDPVELFSLKFYFCFKLINLNYYLRLMFLLGEFRINKTTKPAGVFKNYVDLQQNTMSAEYRSFSFAVDVITNKDRLFNI